jgi:hypothetical protein
MKPKAREAAPVAVPTTLRTDVEFVMMPAELLTDPMLTALDKVVAALMIIYARDRFTCWCCNATLEGHVRASRSTVQRSLRRLEQTGWIAREPAPTTRRGNLVRLLWRYPRPKAKPRQAPTAKSAPPPVSPMTRGGVTGDAGGCHPCHPELDSKPKFENPDARGGSGGDEDLLSQEDLAMWQGFAGGDDRIKRMLASTVLKRHAQAEAEADRAKKEATAGNLAKDPPDVALSKDTVLDSCDCTTDDTHKSRCAVPTEHKGHYK